jgi:deferrochelatase/peroxidase EfeB
MFKTNYLGFLVMTKDTRVLQDGIHYYKMPFLAKHSAEGITKSNDSFAILFLQVTRNSANEVKKSIEGLWKMYDDLKKGYTRDLEKCAFPTGGLTVLIAYGQRIFEIAGVIKKIPVDFKGKQFLPPAGRMPILPGSGIKYSNEMHENVGISEHIAIQLISGTQIGTYRAVVETIKYLQLNNEALRFSKFYTGFQRDDGRSWLGFHDEVSNMKNPNERLRAIAIDETSNSLLPRDYWTRNGTYLAYLRIEIDLDKWNSIERKHQELIIGRDKITGSPLVGVDKHGNPVFDVQCPSAYQVKGFQKSFHEHPDYRKEPKLSNNLRSMLDLNASADILNESHIGRTRHIDNIDSRYRVSRRIFRQGFEFLEPAYQDQTRLIQVGQNFISFQNDPSRLFFILTHPDWMGNINFGGRSKTTKLEELLSVLAAGVFFVPPKERPFPGVCLFADT